MYSKFAKPLQIYKFLPKNLTIFQKKSDFFDKPEEKHKNCHFGKVKNDFFRKRINKKMTRNHHQKYQKSPLEKVDHVQ